jgi:uncharacterized protein (TIGR02246 family)
MGCRLGATHFCRVNKIFKKNTKKIMKSILLTMAGIAISGLTVIAQNSSDETAIRAEVKYLEDGWAKKDGKLFARPFAENADYVVVNGNYLKGKKAIAEGHQFIFDSFYKETFIKADIQSIRFIRPDIALVHVAGHMTGRSNGQPVDTRSFITLTMEKTTAGWLIAAFQNTAVQPPRPTTN